MCGYITYCMFKGQKLIENTSKGPNVTKQTNRAIVYSYVTVWYYCNHHDIEYTVSAHKYDYFVK